MHHLHLTHPRLGFWVTVEIHERDGRFMATADLGEDSRDVGTGDTPQEAVSAALRSLGEPYVSEMALMWLKGLDLASQRVWTPPRPPDSARAMLRDLTL